MKDREIGMLRQWLNEERIKDPKKFVTNADIKFWLGLITGEEMIQENRKENAKWKNMAEKLKKYYER